MHSRYFVHIFWLAFAVGLTGGPRLAAAAPPAHILTGAYSKEFGYNAASTRAQTGAWLTYLEGEDTSTTQVCGGNGCTPLMYWNVSLIAVPFIPGCTANCATQATDLPWAGGDVGVGCPAGVSIRLNGPYLTNPQNGTTIEDWFLHAAGTDRTNSANRIVSDYAAGRDLYFWYAWPGSLSARAFENHVIAHCLVNTSPVPSSGSSSNPQYVAVNNYGGILADDASIDLSRGYAAFALKSNHPGSNVGIYAKAPYYSGACRDLYARAPCSQSQRVLTTNITSSAECSTDSCWNSAIAGTFASWMHGPGGPYAGQRMMVLYNGLVNTDFSVLNGALNIAGGEMEQHITDGGGFTNATYMGDVIDVGATVARNAPQKRFIVENVAQPTDSIGATLHQNKLRLIYGLEWIVFYQNLVDWSAMENIAGASFGKNGVGVWPMDFLYPVQPLTTASPALPPNCSTSGAFGGNGGPCTSGGAFDSSICVNGRAPKCVYRREFQHCFWQPNYFSGASGTDSGPCGVLVNLEDLPVTIQPAWLKQWLSYNGLISLCKLGTNATYTVPKCSGLLSPGVSGSSGGDVNMPGATIDCSLNKSSVTTIPHFDAVFFTARRVAQC